MLVLLTTLTLKSTLKFGIFRGTTVSDMFLQYKELELLKIYYKLGNISFCQEVKDKLFITQDREIEKPGSLRFPHTHPVNGKTCWQLISECLVDFNIANNTASYNRFKNSYLSSVRNGEKHYKKRQWGSDKPYCKGVMAYVNQHYGLSR